MQFNVLSRQGLPLFSTFFFWSVGMGAMHLARPLFAASFGVPVFLVVFVYSTNALARLISGPITGFLVDRWGRKPLLIAGVARAVYFMVVVYGIGSGMTTGTSQVYAMDLAPERRRGAFLGIWSAFNHLSAVLAPLLLGLLAETVGLSTTFVVVSVILAVSALSTWMFGPETLTKSGKKVVNSSG